MYIAIHSLPARWSGGEGKGEKMVVDGINVISVKDRLPTANDLGRGMVFIFHRTGTRLDGRIGFFSPVDKSWAVIGEPFDKDGETTYPFEDVTDLVDYWAVIPLSKLNEMEVES